MGFRLRLIAWASVVLLAASCAEKGVDQPGATEEGTLPTQETRVRKWVEYRGGKRSWEFKGEIVRYYEEPERVESDGVAVDFYDEEEKFLSTLTAERGSIDRKTSDMEARGSVVLTNREGARLETDWIRYENENDRIYTDAFVTLSEGRKRITGYGLRTDPGLENAEILRDVVAFTVEGPENE